MILRLCPSVAVLCLLFSPARCNPLAEPARSPAPSPSPSPSPDSSSDCRFFESLFAQSGKPLPWDSGACCSFRQNYPYAPSFSCYKGRLKEAYLASQGLKGPLPEFGGLDTLQYLDLSGNELVGPIPDVSPLSSLQYIYLYSNHLSGPIPPSFSHLTKLRWLSLSSNNFTGPLPDLRGLGKLQHMYAYGNALRGSVDGLLPSTLSTCQLHKEGDAAGLFTCGGELPASCAGLPEGTAAQCSVGSGTLAGIRDLAGSGWFSGYWGGWAKFILVFVAALVVMSCRRSWRGRVGSGQKYKYAQHPKVRAWGTKSRHLLP